jgi:tRNA(Ile)-lysidine synthase TilS/MesJ
MKGLPHFAVGKVVKGFGRGSKDLGILTVKLQVSQGHHEDQYSHTFFLRVFAKSEN